jgi:hypothetical protein
MNSSIIAFEFFGRSRPLVVMRRTSKLKRLRNRRSQPSEQPKSLMEFASAIYLAFLLIARPSTIAHFPRVSLIQLNNALSRFG